MHKCVASLAHSPSNSPQSSHVSLKGSQLVATDVPPPQGTVSSAT
ncbi:hypothetical protein CGRA01v4_11857 [Colletotrichum graminicola]|nr:hypothetical protein CGRA01v4_11857 [Colletotrichum graminicola]